VGIFWPRAAFLPVCIKPAVKYPTLAIPAKAGHTVLNFKPTGVTIALSSGMTGCRIKSGMTAFAYLVAGLIMLDVVHFMFLLPVP